MSTLETETKDFLIEFNRLIHYLVCDNVEVKYLKNFTDLENRVKEGFRLDSKTVQNLHSLHENIYVKIASLHKYQTKFLSFMKKAGAMSLSETLNKQEDYFFFKTFSKFAPAICLSELRDAQYYNNYILAYYASLKTQYKGVFVTKLLQAIHAFPKEITQEEIGVSLLDKPRKGSAINLLKFLEENQIKVTDKNEVSNFNLIKLFKLYKDEDFSSLIQLGISFENVIFHNLMANSVSHAHMNLDMICSSLNQKNPELLKKWISKPDSKGVYPMHRLAQNRDMESMKVLYKWGASLNIKDASGNTVVHYLMKRYSSKYDQNFEPMLSWFKEQGLNLEEKNNLGNTPINKLAQQGNVNSLTAIVNLLGSNSLKQKNNNGQTALDLIENRRDKQSVKSFAEKALLNNALEQRSDKQTSYQAKKRI